MYTRIEDNLLICWILCWVWDTLGALQTKLNNISLIDKLPKHVRYKMKWMLYILDCWRNWSQCILPGYSLVELGSFLGCCLVVEGSKCFPYILKGEDVLGSSRSKYRAMLSLCKVWHFFSMYYGAFNEVEGSSEALTKLVAVAYAVCDCSDVVVGQQFKSSLEEL